MRVNIHVSFGYSSSGLKEDETTKCPIVKMKLLPFKTYLFFQNHIFSQAFIVWFILAFFDDGWYYPLSSPLLHPLPCPSQPSPWGSERLDMQPILFTKPDDF